jgi:hypothetical protein
MQPVTQPWLVSDYPARGVTKRPKMLHLLGCRHAEYPSGGEWVPGQMRPPIGDERRPPKCSTCLQREATGAT